MPLQWFYIEGISGAEETVNVIESLLQVQANAQPRTDFGIVKVTIGCET